MAGMVLIDSNVYIRSLREHQDPVAMIQKCVEIGNICSCGIVLAEVMRGVIGKRVQEQLLRYFSLTVMLPTTSVLWDDVWQLAWQLDRNGSVIPLTDLIIAACALRANAAVLTFDKHFHQVPDLTVIEP